MFSHLIHSFFSVSLIQHFRAELSFFFVSASTLLPPSRENAQTMSVSSRLLSITPKVAPLCAKATSPRSITAYTACRQTQRAFSTPFPSSTLAPEPPSKDDRRVFFFDIDNCLYPKSAGIARLMGDK